MKLLVVALLMTTALIAQDGPPIGRPPLRERAEKGDAEAQFTLAKNYESGRSGLPTDFKQAGYWYRLSAEQGDPFAQASLALLYRFGKGVPQDNVQAYMWFTLSMNRLSGADRESIEEYRNSAEARMSAGQISEATRLSKEWKPKAEQPKAR